MSRARLVGWALVFLLTVSQVGHADDQVNRALAEEARRIQADPEAAVPADMAKAFREAALGTTISEEDRTLFEGMRDGAQRIAEDAFQAQTTENAPEQDPVALRESKTIFLFVSQSMGEAGLRAAVDSVRGRADAAIVLRGVNKGQTLGQLQRTVLRLLGPASESEPSPGVMIDPTLFTRYAVTVAPTLVYVSDGKAIATARGLTTVDWFRERVTSGQIGDIGQHGETSLVSEEDMVEALKAAAAKRDWKASREKSFRAHWDSLEYLDLAVARTDRLREIDPSFVVTEGITAPDGTVIAYAGQRVNPLDSLPFTQVLIVFDATDPAQRPMVEKALKRAGDRRITLITTKYARATGYEGLGDLWSDFGRPVFILDRDLRERFAIERVPSFIEARGNRFLVHEMAIP